MEDAVFPVKGSTATTNTTTAMMYRNDEGATRQVPFDGLSSVNHATTTSNVKVNVNVTAVNNINNVNDATTIVDSNDGREQPPPPNDTTESIYDQMRPPTLTNLEQEVILYDDYHQQQQSRTTSSFEEKLDYYYNNNDNTNDGDTIPFDEMGMDEEQSILEDLCAGVEAAAAFTGGRSSAVAAGDDSEAREEAEEGFAMSSLFRRACTILLWERKFFC